MTSQRETIHHNPTLSNFFHGTLLRLAFQLLVVLILAWTSARPQEPKFDHITVEDGLSQDIVRCIAQDRHGFMWFGTEDGLNRYDGYSISVYKHNPLDSNSISNSSIEVLYSDSRGAFWIGTDDGLNLYDEERDAFVHFRYDSTDVSSVSSNGIFAICEDTTGNLWVGTGNGLNRYDAGSKTFTRYHHDPRDTGSVSADIIGALCIDMAGTLWVGVTNGLNAYLNAYDEKTGRFRQYFRDEANRSGSISCLFSDSKGLLWVCYERNGVTRLDRNTGQVLRFGREGGAEYGLPDLRVFSAAEDDKGNIWLGFFSSLAKFDRATNSLVHYRNNPSNPHSLSSDRVYSIAKDRAGTLWIGTWHGGINRYDPDRQKFLLYQNVPNDERSLSNNGVLSVLEDRAGIMWVGTAGGGLNRYDPATGSFAQFKHVPGDARSISSNVVTSLCEDRRGNLWVGCAENGGLDVLQPGSNLFRHFPLKEVRTIYEDSESNLWIGLHGDGLARLNPSTNTIARYRSSPQDPDSLHGAGVWSIHEDRRGGIWLGGWAGEAATLNRFDKSAGKFTHYTLDRVAPQGAPALWVRSMHEDAEGFLWLATWGTGLYKLDPRTGTLKQYTENNGLPNNFVKGILADNTGNLWISTEMGLSRFTPRTEAFRNFTTDDGLQGNRFLSGSCFKGAGGQMMFGGENGLNVFHPDSIRNNPHAPPVVITQFRVFDKPMRPKGATAWLSYDQDFMSFEFVALDYTAPQRNLYAYMMEGFDRDWVDAGTRRYAAYTHLDGGEYIFRVKASNNDGVWNEQGASMRIIISPPFWKTWWFITMAAITFLATVLMTYHRQISKVRHDRRVQQNFSRQLIESQENERKRVAIDLHDGLGQTLLIIKNKLLMGLKQPPGHVPSLDLFRDASEAASQALQEVRDISQNLRPHHLDQLGLTVAIESIVEKVAESSGVDFVTSLENIDGLISHDNEINVYRIVQESLNNIVKHSNAGNASVKVTRGEQLIVATIEDDGKGMGQTNPMTQGSGIFHMTERARILGGQITFHEREGGGTIMKLTMPIQEPPHQPHHGLP